MWNKITINLICLIFCRTIGPLFVSHDPRSSNGRTAAFEAVNHGSNPCLGTKTPRIFAGFFVVKLAREKIDKLELFT